MKHIKNHIVIAALLLAPIYSFAQDIDGLDISDEITKEQMIAKFGKPDKYYEYDDELGKMQCYRYGSSLIKICDNYLGDFIICDKRFNILTKYISGGVRVGDKLSKLNNSKYGTPKKADWMGSGVYYLAIMTDDWVFFNVENGVIVCINYHMLV